VPERDHFTKYYIFGCQAPDAGNVEILYKYGMVDQKEHYLRPLLEGRIRISRQ